MISQSGTLYKIIVTSCVLLGVNQLSLSNGSPVASDVVAPTSLSHALYNLHYPPSGPTGTGLFFTAGDIAAAESGSLFGDGAIASHPLHSLMPGDGMDLLNVGAGGNQFLRTIVAPHQSDDLQTAGQSYFIEPPTPTTTTQKPTFKKRKTRRPISSLAEKSKKDKPVESDNSANNEVFQGNPVTFNPFRQIVNTSFGRKRPSDNRQERPRSRPSAANKQETGSAAADEQNNEQKSIDSLNEIPKTEGELPRAAGRRRPAQDLRPVRPTTTVASDDSNLNEPPKGRRYPLRKPRPSFDAPAASGDEGADNANQKPLRPRNFAKRPRPRPTTTIAAPATETDSAIETTYPATVNHHLSTLPALPVPVAEARPRVRPARPLTVNRFANANRNAATTTPSSIDSTDEYPISSLPPASSPRRRPLRPTTRQHSFTTSTEAPEDVLKNHVSDVSSAPGTGRGRGDGPQRPLREGRQGFLLRPKPTPYVDPSEPADEHLAQNEVGIRRPLSNRRRKRPTTTTVASPASPAVSYNQAFVGGVVESNVIPTAPARERHIPGGRRVQGSRARPTPLPALSSGDEPHAYQVQEEQRAPHPVNRNPGQSQNLGIPSGQYLTHQQGTPSPISGPSLLRRPTGPSAPSAIGPQSPIHQAFNSNAGFVDPNNFVNPHLFPIQQDNLGFYPGLDNVLGVPSNANFRSIKQSLGASEFSSRSAGALDEPEISYNDFTPAASTEKQTVASPPNSNTDATPSAAADQENKPEPENKKGPSAKLSPLERLQQNRQAAARRLLAPRKPTERTATVAPAAVNHKAAAFRKSIIPPRMLRPRGKLPGASAPAQEQPVPNDGRENDSAAVEEKPSSNNEAGGGTVAEIINDSTSSAATETDKQANTIPISPNPKEEEKEASTRKPSILEAAKRRRVNSVLSKNTAAPAPPQQQQQQQKLKITPAPPPNHDPEAAPPTCEDGQRYSKFLKRCVTMYKPKTQG